MTRARFVPLPPKRMLALGTRRRFVEVALTVRLLAVLSTSPTMKGMRPVEVSSLMVWSGIAEMVGASFTEVTVSRKLVFVPADRFGSISERVIVALPNWFGSGVTVTVRLLPVPPKTILLFGTRAGFEEEPLTVNRLAEVWELPTVKARAAVEVSSLIVWPAMLVMVGIALLEALT